MAKPAAQQSITLQNAFQTWILFWFGISSLVVLWDAGYIFSRPHSFLGGALHHFWSPYALYQNIDYIYGLPAFETKNGFPAAQSFMNVIECLLNFTFLGLHRSRPVESVIIGLCAVVMTLSKTVLYWANEYFSGYSSIGHNDAWTLFVYWIIPNGIWLVVPSLILHVFVKDVHEALHMASFEGAPQKKRS